MTLEIYLFLFYMYACLICMYVYVLYMPDTLRSQETILDYLELELEMVVGHHVSAGK